MNTFTWITADAASDNDRWQWSRSAVSADGSVLLVAMDWGGLFVSDDGTGAVWRELMPNGIPWLEGDPPLSYTAMAMSDDGNRIVVGGNAGRLWTTSDRGVTWSERRPGGIDSDRAWQAVACDSTGLKIFAAEDGSWELGLGHLWTSTDGGATWTERMPGGDSASRWWWTVGSSSDGQTLVATTHRDVNVVWKSTDGGATWSDITPFDRNEDWEWLAIDATGTKILAASHYYDGSAVNDPTPRPSGIYRSTDGGSSWGRIGPFPDETSYYNSVFMSRDGSTVAVLYDVCYLSFDGGSTWSTESPYGEETDSYSHISFSANGAQSIICTWYLNWEQPKTGRVWVGSRQVTPPTPPTPPKSPPGVDIWLGDIDGSGTPETTTTPAKDWLLAGAEEAYKQSLRRRFLTSPGDYKNKPDYGAGLMAAVKIASTRSNRAKIASALKQQALLDHRTRRVISVTVDVFATNGIHYSVVVEMRGGSGAPLTISDHITGGV